MPQRTRVAAGIAALAVIVVGFMVLKPSDEQRTGASTTVSSAPASSAPAEPAAKKQPAVTLIRVRGGKPVGDGVPITVKQGGTIRFTVTSNEAQEIHFHGYDIAKDAAPGRPARFVLPARIGGVFEVELEGPGIQIAKVTVGP